MIVNADDLGYTPGVTMAIVAGFERGLISSATLMPNMPATDEACELVRQKKLADHIGLHLVLDEGEPLTAAIRHCRRFCDAGGRLVFAGRRRTFRLDTSEKAALAGEVRAQVARLRRTGVPLTHLDSHHFVHTAWAVGAVVLAVAREERIPFVRLMRNCGPRQGVLGRVYRGLFNARVRRHGLARTRFMGDVADAVHLMEKKRIDKLPDDIEVMVHPDLDAQGRVVNLPFDETLEESVRRLPGFGAAVSFSGHRHGNRNSVARPAITPV